MVFKRLTSLIYRDEEAIVYNNHQSEYSKAACAILCPIVMTAATTMITFVMAENLWHNGGRAQDVAMDAAVIIVGGMALAISGSTIYDSIAYFRAAPYYCCNTPQLYPDNAGVLARVVFVGVATDQLTDVSSEA